jgi:hypothetical protein
MGGHGTRPLRWAAGLAGLALLCGGCANAMAGSATAVVTKPVTVAQVRTQALADLAQAGLLHFTGTVTQPSESDVTVDLSATASGEVDGTLKTAGQTAQMISVDDALYLNGPAGFWQAVTDVKPGQDSATYNQWVKVPADAFGIDFGKLAPTALSQNLSTDLKPDPKTDGMAYAKAPTSGSGTTETVTQTGGGTTVLLSAKAPYGLTHLKMPGVEGAQLDFAVTETTGSLTQVYGTLSQQAKQLPQAIDPAIDIGQGSQTWGPCSAANCAVIVTVTNNAPAPVAVLINGTWTGDNAPVGNCVVTTPPVAPKQTTNATCTVNSPGWTGFYNHARSTPGSHPYQVLWTANAVATPPADLGAVATNATAAGKAAGAGGSGADAVFEIGYQDNSRHTQVWKYGVTAAKNWQTAVAPEVTTCLAEQKTSCSVSLVGRTDDRPSADALVRNLVNKAKSDAGSCPPGQWAVCD